MKQIAPVAYAAVAVLILVIAGCAGTEYTPSPEIIRMRALGQIRRDIEAEAETVPPVAVGEAGVLEPAQLDDFEGIWRVVIDMRPQQDISYERIFHFEADQFFYQEFSQNEHGPAYMFAARGSMVRDVHERTYFDTHEIRLFDPNLNMAGRWEDYTGQDVWHLEHIHGPFVLRADPNARAILLYRITPDEVELNVVRPYVPEDYLARFSEQDAGLQYLQ